MKKNTQSVLGNTLIFKTILFLVLFCSVTTYAQTPKWYRELSGLLGRKQIDALAVDSSDSLYYAFHYGADGELLVLKMDTNGNILWNTHFPDANNTDISGAKIVNNGGTDYLYLSVDSQSSTQGYQQLGLACIDLSTGTPQWWYDYVQTETNRDSHGFSVGSDGSLLITAEDVILFLDKNGNMLDQYGKTNIPFVKTPVDLTSVTSLTLNNTVNTSTDMPFDTGSPLDNTPTATGVEYNKELNWAFGTKIPDDPEGTTYNIKSDPFANGELTQSILMVYRAAILNDDGFYIHYTASVGFIEQQAIVKLNKTDKSTVEWNYNWRQNTEGGSMVEDENGDIYLITWDGLYFQNSTNIDLLMNKFDKNGNIQWTKIFGNDNSNGNGNEAIISSSSVAIDTTNDRILINSYTDSFDGVNAKGAMLVINYDGELQNYTIVGKTGEELTPNSIAIDNHGNVFGAGIKKTTVSFYGLPAIYKINTSTIFNCPDGFTCETVTETICSEETYTTTNGHTISETTSGYKETIGTVITTYNINVDESVHCCPDGVTCTDDSAVLCSTSTYLTANGATYTEAGTYQEMIDATNRINWTITLDEDVFCCPQGVNCTADSGIVCTEGTFVTPNSTNYTTAGTYQEVVDASNRINWTITEDTDINCCPDGFTCNVSNETITEATFTSPLGATLSENGTVIDTDDNAKTRDTYVVTFTRANATGTAIVDATVSSGGSVSYEARTGITGVLTFDKNNQDHIILNTLQDDLVNGDGTSKSRSVFMWVKAVENTTSGAALFAMNTATGGNESILWIDANNDNLEINDGNNNQSASFNMGGEVWHYVGYTYDVTTKETVVYVDGIENDRFTNNQDADTGTQYALGMEFDDSTKSDFMDGSMAEISIWDTVLTGEELRIAMKEKITASHPKYTNLVGYYSAFGTESDDTSVLKDHSGKGNDGTIVNFTVDYTNVDNIEGFNSVEWYDNISWLKDGEEVGTGNTFTTNVATGNYEFVVSRDYIRTANAWSMTANSNTITIDNIFDTTECDTNVLNYTMTVPTSDKVTYLDFEKDNENWVDASALISGITGTSRSIFMWVNKESVVPSGTSYQLFTISGDNGEEAVTRFYISASERLGFTTDGTDYVAGSSGTVSLGVWTHIGYTYDSATNETILYVNGTAVRTATKAMPVTSGSRATMGMRYDADGPSRFFDGKLAEITVWDKVLDATEISSLITASPAADATNLVSYYGPLQAAVDNRVFDVTGNGYDGTVSDASILISDAQESLSNYDARTNWVYSWKKDGVEFDTDTAAEVTPEDGAINYSASFGNAMFLTEDVFRITYTELVPTEPTDKTEDVENSVTFSVDSVDGAIYQWYQGVEGFSTSLTNNSDSNAENQIQGATTNELTINNLTLSLDSEKFYVVVSKDGCMKTSNAVLLTLNSATLSEEEVDNLEKSDSLIVYHDRNQFKVNQENVIIEVYNMMGIKLENNDLINGIYILKIIDKEGKTYIKRMAKH